MVETLTESFCERCGTRYEFRAPTRLNPLRKTRGFIGGLKNYLTSQDALGDAMGDAMRSEEDQLASAQLDAFHETFNFCISCRQYTCVNCWNDGDGRCRTCSPIPGTDDLGERLLAIQPGAAPEAASAAAEPLLAGDEVSRRLGIDGWPGAEAMPAAIGTNGDTAHAWPDADPLGAGATEPPAGPAQLGAEAEPEPVAAELEPAPAFEPEPVAAELEPEPEPVAVELELEPVAAEIEPEPEFQLDPVVAEEAMPWIEPDTWVEPAAASWTDPGAAEQLQAEPSIPEAEPISEVVPEPVVPSLRVVAWEDDSAFEVVESSAEVDTLVSGDEQGVAAEVEPEPVAAEVEPEPEPVAAEVEPEPEPEPVAPPAEPQPLPQVAPISETILRFPTRPAEPPAPAEAPAVAAEADTPELAARRAQLDLLGLGDPGEGAVTPERPAVLPYRSRGATPSRAELAMRAGGPGFWEASAREVAGAAAQIGVQNCGECGLSLSATARFCRRCGTRQARSA